MPQTRQAVANLASVWASIDRLMSDLDPGEWQKPTDCPGWTVKDQLSHLIGIELLLSGATSPPPVEAPHVRNPMGAANEGWIAARRDRPPGEVLAEFRQVTAARLEALSAMTDEAWEAPTASPIGEVPYGEFMAVRVMDSWVHEQDVRRAVGRPGDGDGPAAAAALFRLTRSLGYVVGKQAGAPEGTSVVVRLTGPLAQVLAVTVTGGRARPGRAPEDPDVTLTMTAETYSCLSCGRWPPEQVLADGRVRVDGDTELAGRVVSKMNFML